MKQTFNFKIQRRRIKIAKIKLTILYVQGRIETPDRPWEFKKIDKQILFYLIE